MWLYVPRMCAYNYNFSIAIIEVLHVLLVILTRFLNVTDSNVPNTDEAVAPLLNSKAIGEDEKMVLIKILEIKDNIDVRMDQCINIMGRIGAIYTCTCM